MSDGNTSLFEETLKELMKQAEVDGVITPEELDIINQVKVDADSYNMVLQESLSDGLINEEEAHHLENLKQMIIDRAEIIAKVDGKVDRSEEALLKKLSEILQKRYANPSHN